MVGLIDIPTLITFDCILRALLQYLSLLSTVEFALLKLWFLIELKGSMSMKNILSRGNGWLAWQ